MSGAHEPKSLIGRVNDERAEFGNSPGGGGWQNNDACPSSQARPRSHRRHPLRLVWREQRRRKDAGGALRGDRAAVRR